MWNFLIFLIGAFLAYTLDSTVSVLCAGAAMLISLNKLLGNIP